MKLEEQENDQLGEYLRAFNALIGDQRSERTFGAVIEGIIGSESLKAAQISRFSPYAGSREMV